MWTVVVALGASVAIVVATLAHSRASGRLSATPAVDNVIYLARGARFADAWERGGWRGLREAYLAKPQHVSWSSANAFVSDLA